MRIGIVGVDELGTTLAGSWANAGHQVTIGDPRPAPADGGLVDHLGPAVRMTTVEDAARFGDVVVLAVPFGRPEMLPSAAAVAGKIVIDAMNAVTVSGEPMDMGGRASSSIVAEAFPDAYIVKAFNTIPADVVRAEARRSAPSDQRFVIFLAGDEVRANARVSTLIEELGFTPVDTGSLAWGGRLQEPGSDLFGRHLLPAEARRRLRMIS